MSEYTEPPIVQAERLIKDAFYDARNAGRTMDQAALDAAGKLAHAGLLVVRVRA